MENDPMEGYAAVADRLLDHWRISGWEVDFSYFQNVVRPRIKVTLINQRSGDTLTLHTADVAGTLTQLCLLREY